MAVSGQKRGSSVHVQLHDDTKNVTNVAELKNVKTVSCNTAARDFKEQLRQMAITLRPCPPFPLF